MSGKIDDIGANEPQVSALQTMGLSLTAQQRWTTGLAGKPGRNGNQVLNHQAVIPLIAALKCSDWEVRQAAARIFGEISASRAGESRMTALADEIMILRLCAAKALEKLGHKSH